MSYIEELKFIEESPDNIFPEYLFKPMKNDFGDNYYHKGISSDPLTLKAKSLRRKYSNYFDYIDAVDVYNEYIELLIEKYGSWSIIKNNNKIGLLDDILPPKPKLKKNRRNREYMKAGIVPSRKHMDAVDDDVNIKELSRKMIPGEFGENIDESDNYKKPSKESRKMLKQMAIEMAGKQRRKNLYSNISSSGGTDFIIEYFNQANRGVYDEKGDYVERSIYEIYMEDEEAKMIPKELLDADLLSNTPQIVNGRYVKRSDIEQIELLKELYEAGIDLIGTSSKNMDKSAVKLLRRQVGYASEPMTKKELKKHKKRMKNEKKRLERQRDADSALSNILLKNKISDNGSINFRLRDIYKD